MTWSVQQVERLTTIQSLFRQHNQVYQIMRTMRCTNMLGVLS